MIVGTRYRLPDGREGVAIARWLGNDCPRNVLLLLDDGTKTVRPFRGLRRAT